jgi:hypothetical protein
MVVVVVDDCIIVVDPLAEIVELIFAVTVEVKLCRDAVEVKLFTDAVEVKLIADAVVVKLIADLDVVKLFVDEEFEAELVVM